MTAHSPAPYRQAEVALTIQATLGEGPLWCTSRRVLFWVDILANQVHRFDPVTRTDTSWDVGEHVGTVVTRATGGLTLAVRRGFAHFDLVSATLDLVAQPERDRTTNRFNDGKCDPAGRFWAGTMAYDTAAGAGSLYRMDADGSVHVMERNITISNGLTWDLARGLFYYIDSPTRTIAAYTYDHASGAISNRRIVVQATPEDGFPDGMALDAEGMLWVAHWGGSQVIRWNPATGRALSRIRVPVSQPSACAFGGDALDRLYITSARVDLTPAQLAKQPLAGSLFVVDPGVTGVAHTPFAG